MSSAKPSTPVGDSHYKLQLHVIDFNTRDDEGIVRMPATCDGLTVILSRDSHAQNVITAHRVLQTYLSTSIYPGLFHAKLPESC